MSAGHIISQIDVAQVMVWLFFLFFGGLILHLRAEDKREGYPLKDPAGGGDEQGFPAMPAPKTFILIEGGLAYAPHPETERPLAARRQFDFPGSPLVPTGDPLADGVGPAAFVARKDAPLIYETDKIQLAPMRALDGWSLADGDPDPRGMTVIGADGVAAGVVRDLWIDRSVKILRYLEVEVTLGDDARRTLLPIFYTDIRRRKGAVKVRAVRAAQFRFAPQLREPNSVTAREEDQVNAFYAGAQFFNRQAQEAAS